MPTTITTFRNVRARLYRVATGVRLSGWVTHLDRDEARVRLWNSAPLDLGERIVCECFGQGAVARFVGTVAGQAGDEVACDLTGSISYAPSDETPRVQGSGLIGSLQKDGDGMAMRILDLSARSLGVLAEAAYRRGETLTMNLPTEIGPIAAKVSVANCRPDPARAGHFRIGLQIMEIDRLDEARWSRVVAERALA